MAISKETKLPLHLNRFVGRESELDQLKLLMSAGARLVTVAGPGGIGKTRVVTEFARRTKEEGTTVLFVDLSRHDSFTTALGESLDVAAGTIEDAVNALGAKAGSSMLVVLDNLEHLIDESVRTVPLLLQFASIKIIATSREPLRLGGEQVIRLGPLNEDEAMELFELRAKAIIPDFAASEGGDAIREILDRVDRLPLAIELAASRINVLPPEGLAERLTKRMSALKSRDRDRPERHRTVNATARWSWELLNDEERDVLRQLSVFRGAFRLADGERVATVNGGSAVDIIEDLVDRSMLERVDQGTFRLFQTIYGLAAVELESSDDVQEVYDRHANHFSNLVLTTKRHQRAKLGQFVPELRIAFDRTTGETQARTLAAAASVLTESGGVQTLLSEIQSVVDAVGGECQAELEYAAAIGFLDRIDLQNCSNYATRAAESAKKAGNNELAALATVNAALADSWGGNHKGAVDKLRGALDLTAGSTHAEVAVRSNLGIVLAKLGQDDEATEHISLALERARSSGEDLVLARLLSNIGFWHAERHRWPDAERFLTESLGILDTVVDRRFQAHTLVQLGHANAAQGRPDPAREFYRRASQTAKEYGQLSVRLDAQIGLGSLRDSHEDRTYLVKAADLANTSGSIREELMARNMLMLFDMKFGSFPMARHQARRLDGDANIPEDWRLVIQTLAALIDAWSGGLPETLTMTGEPWTDQLREVINEMVQATSDVANASTHAFEARKGLDALMQRSAPESMLAWPAMHVAPVLLAMLDERFPAAAANSLRIHPEGRYFVPPGQAVVDFARRGALRGVLVGLAKARDENPGHALSLEDVLELGWPGEIIQYEAGASRVYTAIRTLRNAGLGDILQTSDEGYFLSPDVAIIWDPELSKAS